MTAARSFRPLTTAEVDILQQRGCRTREGDWSGVQVADGFDPQRLHQVSFGGQVRVGALRGFATASGPSAGGGTADRLAEIAHACLEDCELGDDVRVVQVGRLENYEVGAEACIEHVDRIVSTRDARFGNGVEAAVLNEGGGREVILFNGLSSQFAHLMCLVRHRPVLVGRLRDMASSAARAAHRSRGVVGDGAEICGVREIVDVHVGPAASIRGALRLHNGTVLSEPEARTTIGAGVEAENFILAEGSSLVQSALITDTYVGQGCRVGRQFSAENSLFFANCEAFHGEACSVLAGPYTVTHHKSSLLIAGMFSFFNAGSGANQSNHLYKLGPVHEGKVERGAKMGSSAYMMWPCRVGPFTVVLGKHTRPFDVSQFPFSHIEATSEGRSSLIPGFNMATVGVMRDGAKWPTRDRRRSRVKRDRISFEVFSPLTVGRMAMGLERLKELQQSTDKSIDAVTVNGADVKRVFLRTGQKYYRRGIHMYLCDRVVDRVERQVAAGASSCREALSSSPQAVWSDVWLDLGGQLLPARRLEDLCASIEAGEIADVPQLEERLDAIEGCRAEDEWTWVQHAYRRAFGVNLEEATSRELSEAASTLLEVRTEFLNLVLLDASKEFDAQSRTGFGVDGAEETSAADFLAVRGDFDANPFVREVRAEVELLAARVERFHQMVAQISES